MERNRKQRFAATSTHYPCQPNLANGETVRKPEQIGEPAVAGNDKFCEFSSRKFTRLD